MAYPVIIPMRAHASTTLTYLFYNMDSLVLQNERSNTSIERDLILKPSFKYILRKEQDAIVKSLKEFIT